MALNLNEKAVIRLIISEYGLQPAEMQDLGNDDTAARAKISACAPGMIARRAKAADELTLLQSVYIAPETT